MGIFRSVTMSHGTLVIPQERARDCVDLLCRHTNIQFVDMNEKRMERPYKKYIQRILNMERMIRVLNEEITSLPGTCIIKNRIDDFLKHDSTYKLDQVEESLIKLYGQFEKFKQNDIMLKNELEEVLNEYSVMLVAKRQLDEGNEQSFLAVDSPSPKSETTTEENTDSRVSLLPENEARSDMVVTEMMNMPATVETVQNESSLCFSNIAGIISAQDKDAFSRAIFRAMRGNVYTFFQDNRVLKDIMLGRSLITEEEATEHDKDEKVVFVIYCQSSASSSTYNKLNKLCGGFQAKLFEWSKSAAHINKRLSELEEIIRDKQKAVNAYKKYFREEIACLLECTRPDGNSVIEEWLLFCRKEKYIYFILNHFEATDITLRADCWFPEEEEENIRSNLLADKSQDRVSALLLVDHQFDKSKCYEDPATMPPTYNKCNSFTQSFQNVVDTYGVPRYKEMNPAPFTIITFPFLFGIMFGDIGHGMCVSLFGLFVVLAYPKLKQKYTDEMASMILNGRYMILMMGLMATYTGFIYNDFLSLPNNLFGTCWERNPDASTRVSLGQGEYLETLLPSEARFPIGFGLDAAWIHSKNEQPMLHSFKMKLSVIVGFLQMTLGVILKGCNALYFRKPLDFFFEFIPQMVLMISFVGYMSFLIVYKWVTPLNNGYAKPSIITTMIDMCLMKNLGKDDIMFEGQQTVQRILLFLMLVSVPMMFFPKPILLYLAQKRRLVIGGDKRKKDHEMVYCGPDDPELGNYSERSTDTFNMGKRGSSSQFKHLSDDEDAQEGQFAVTIHKDGSVTEDDSSHGEHSIADIFIHQLIETIEFSLGIISNTASYLRLWALSLSHQQLSLVFFKQTIFRPLVSDYGLVGTVITLFISSIFFALVTFAVMLCMDSLECYLHGLRLQWVEFQNKFYKADGKAFRPFNIKMLLESNEEDPMLE